MGQCRGRSLPPICRIRQVRSHIRRQISHRVGPAAGISAGKGQPDPILQHQRIRPFIIDGAALVLPCIQGSGQQNRLACQLPGPLIIRRGNIQHGTRILLRTNTAAVGPYQPGFSRCRKICHIQCDTVLCEKTSVLSSHPDRLFPVFSADNAPALFQLHHVSLRRPYLSAHSEQQIHRAPDHMKFRRPKGLNQIPALIPVQNAVFLYILRKKTLHPVRLPHPDSYVIAIVIRRYEIPCALPPKHYRIRIPAGQREPKGGPVHPPLQTPDAVLLLHGAVSAPADALFIGGAVAVAYPCPDLLQLFPGGYTDLIRQLHRHRVQRSPGPADLFPQLPGNLQYPETVPGLSLHQSMLPEANKVLCSPQQHLIRSHSVSGSVHTLCSYAVPALQLHKHRIRQPSYLQGIVLPYLGPGKKYSIILVQRLKAASILTVI